MTPSKIMLKRHSWRVNPSIVQQWALSVNTDLMWPAAEIKDRLSQTARYQSSVRRSHRHKWAFTEEKHFVLHFKLYTKHLWSMRLYSAHLSLSSLHVLFFCWSSTLNPQHFSTKGEYVNRPNDALHSVIDAAYYFYNSSGLHYISHGA